MGDTRFYSRKQNFLILYNACMRITKPIRALRYAMSKLDRWNLSSYRV